MTRRDGSEEGGLAVLLIENSSALAILIERIENLWSPIDSRTDPRSDNRARFILALRSLSVSLHRIGCYVSDLYPANPGKSFALMEGIKQHGERKDSRRISFSFPKILPLCESIAFSR